MEIRMTGEVDKDVAEPWRNLNNEIGKKINDKVKNVDYGDAVNRLWILHMILGEDFLQAMKWPERRRYKLKTKDTEFRLKIDHDTFLHADEEGKRRLLLKNIIDAIRYLKSRIRKGFDADRLERDILGLFQIASYEQLFS